MTIQFYPNKNMVRLGEKYFPAEPFPGMDDQSYPRPMGYKIPIGESGKFLSIAIGIGSYSDNLSTVGGSMTWSSTETIHGISASVAPDSKVDLSAEMQYVEVGYGFQDEFDVKPFVNDEELIEMIHKTMSGLDPWVGPLTAL